MDGKEAGHFFDRVVAVAALSAAEAVLGPRVIG